MLAFSLALASLLIIGAYDFSFASAAPLPKVEKPTFSPPAGTYPAPQNVTINCSTEGAVIRYTIDGSEPSNSSTIYLAPISVSVTTTIRAQAFKVNMTESDTAIATYTINLGKVANPTFSPPNGTYNAPQSVTILCATVGSSIYYTTNGADPTTSSYFYVSPVLVNNNTIIKARAFKSFMTPSEIVSASYTLKVATPDFSPPAGTYGDVTLVAIQCDTSGASIRYTTNGAEPTSSSTLYSGPLSFNATTPLKAKAFKSGWTDSDTAAAVYTINLPRVATPTFGLAGGTYFSSQTVAIECDTPGAIIRYTTNGADPSPSSTVYSAPVLLSGTTTLKAKAFKNNMLDSFTVSATYTIKVATPDISLPSGTYYSSQMVTLSCDTTGANIRYTTNGADPTSTSGNIYSAPFSVGSSMTLKARAFKPDWTDSDVASATYTIKVATPSFTPSGGTFFGGQSVVIQCATSGATIRYTTNGAEPTSSSTLYSGPISVSSTTTLKAKAFKSGVTESDTAQATYTIKVADPTFSPPSGIYTSSQSVTISCATSGVTIRYTTNGDTPTSSSTLYSGPINVGSSMTVKAKAFKSGWTDSDVASEVYTIKVATPSMSPEGGNYSSSQTVTIQCPTSGATIRYTLDGTSPSSSSPVFSSPILVSASTTIKAKAFKAGLVDSDVATAIYEVNLLKVAAPTFSPPGGTYYSSQSVTLGSNTPDATVRYTTDGSEPGSSSTVYSSPVSVSSSKTLKAKAFKNDMIDSDTAQAAYVITDEPQPDKVSTPIFSPGGGSYSSPQSVSLSCATSDATIRFTVDGSAPSGSSAVYSSPISVGESTTIKAKAFKSGMTDSDTASATYTISAPGKVATPTFSPNAGSYDSAQSVVIECADSGAVIRYTTSGLYPDLYSPVYSGPISVTATTTIRARAFMSGMEDSEIASATYTIGTDPGSGGEGPGFGLEVGYAAIAVVAVVAVVGELLFYFRRRRKLPVQDATAAPQDSASL